jgi:hypothetical protein
MQMQKSLLIQHRRLFLGGSVRQEFNAGSSDHREMPLNWDARFIGNQLGDLANCNGLSLSYVSLIIHIL